MHECDTSVVELCDSDFWTLSQNFEKQVLTLLCLSVCVSTRNNSALTGQIFINFDHCVFSKNLLRKFMFRYNWSRTVGTLHEDQYTFLITSHLVLIIMRTVGDKTCRESQNMHFMLNNLFHWESCNLWGNAERYCGPEQAPCDNWAHDHCRLDTYGYRHTLRICTDIDIFANCSWVDTQWQ